MTGVLKRICLKVSQGRPQTSQGQEKTLLLARSQRAKVKPFSAVQHQEGTIYFAHDESRQTDFV